MKNIRYPILFLLFLCLNIHLSYAQEIGGCGAIASPEAIHKMDSLQEDVMQYTRDFEENRSILMTSIPVQAHIINQTNGTGGLSISDWNDAFNNLNVLYQPSNITFFECSPPNMINSSTYYDLETDEESALHSAHGVANVINIYIPGGSLTSSSSGGSLCGYAYFPWSNGPDLITVSESCMNNGSTLPHEIGHYLGLYHTHGKTNCGSLTDELVNGSNCSFAGDDVCDTPADPNLQGVDCDGFVVNTSCIYTGNATDANGQFFNPDPSNIMSYSRKACRINFSSGQMSRASFYATTARDYLFCATACNPPSGLTISSLGYSHFMPSWNSVSGAIQYQTRIRTVGNSSWIDGGWFTGTSIVWANAIPCNNYEVQVRADCNGSISSWSSSYTFTTDGCGDPYCYNYGLTWDHWIEGITFSNMSNPSNNGYGYTNFTNEVADVVRGESYTISLNPDSDINSTTVYWRVWIDFNGDNDFEDSGEQVLSQTGNSLSITSGTISIPAGAAMGLTRMRVAMSPDGSPSLCQTGNNQDVEDYGINIQDPPCAVPDNFVAENITYSFVELDWDPVPEASLYQTRRRIQGSSTWEEGSWFASSSVFWANNTPCSTYEFQVRTDCNGAFSDFSSSIFVDTEGCGDPYCYSYGISWDNWIEQVDFAGIFNTSNNNYGYANYTNLTADVEKGQTYTITLTPGTDVAPITSYWKVWIDFNGDNDFEDSGEEVVSQMEDSDVTISPNITISTGAITGTTRMRVAMSPNGYTSPCDTEAAIEVEDYSVEISAPTPILDVTPQSISFGTSADSETINVTSNVSWSASESASWLSLNNASGSNNGSFTINCTTNTSTSSRTATVTVMGGGLTRTISVTQAGADPSLSVSPQTVNFGAAADNETINVTSNVSWSASESVAWLSLNNASGSNNGSFTINCTENNSSSSRTATVTVIGGGLTRTISVTQAGADPTLSVSPQTVNFGTAADNETIDVSSNVSWSASENVAWLSLNNANGNNNGSFTINCTENISSSSRTATVTVMGGNITQTISVTQDGASSSGPPWGNPTATIASGTLIGQIQINGIPADAGDWVGAFDEDGNLAGSKEVIINQGIAYINLVIYGDDSNTPNDEGINAGESFTIQLYDASEDEVLTYPNASDTFAFTEWANTNGAPIPAYSSPDDVYNFSGVSLSFDPTSITLDWTGSPVNGFLTTGDNISWTAAASEGWLLVTPANGTGSQFVVIEANSPNMDASPRFGTITFESGSVSIEVSVTQEGNDGSGPPWGNPIPTISSGTFIGQIQINGIPASEGDWLAAFDEDGNLAGSKELIINQGLAYTNMVIYGDDTNTPVDEGINAGESFTLRLFDASANQTLEYIVSGNVYAFTEWENTNGAPMPAYNDPNDIYNFISSAFDIIPLAAGWNLVSTDVIPSDSSVSSLMSDLLPGNLEYVTGFDGAANFYDPTLPDIFSTLTHWERGFGYWVKVTEADTLYIAGDLINPGYFKPMDNNWNLIAYLPQDAQAPDQYLSAFLAAEQLEYVTGFDGAFQFYDPFGLPFLNDLTSMRNSKGYWIKLNLGEGLDENWNRNNQNIANPNYEFIWGYTDLAVGSTIDVQDENGMIWLQLLVGENKAILPQAIYGDDPTTAAIEGPQAGDKLSFVFNGQASNIPYIFNSDLSLHEMDINFGVSKQTKLITSPNPFKEELYIQFDLASTEEATIHITDIYGQQVFRQNVQSNQTGWQQISWAPENSTNGLYFINLYQGNKLVGITKAMLVK